MAMGIVVAMGMVVGIRMVVVVMVGGWCSQTASVRLSSRMARRTWPHAASRMQRPRAGVGYVASITSSPITTTPQRGSSTRGALMRSAGLVRPSHARVSRR